MIDGETKEGACTWCKRPVVLVWRLYPPHAGVAGGFWSVERCSCFESVERHGRAILKELKSRAHDPKQYRNGVPLK